MAAWENVFILKRVMEAERISGKPGDVQADRRKIRDGLAKLKTTEGLIGTTKRDAEREADKPYLFVHANKGEWKVLYNPL
jgi:branched-chain amino acid transport system substrate-binding protein